MGLRPEERGKIQGRLEKTFGLRDDFPQVGCERNDLKSGTRTHAYRRHVIMCRDEAGVLTGAVILGTKTSRGCSANSNKV